VDDEPAVVRVRQPRAIGPVRGVGGGSSSAEEAVRGCASRSRSTTTCVPSTTLRFDPLLGRALRAQPRLRVRRRPEPFEALRGHLRAADRAERAAAIQRRIVRRWAACELNDLRMRRLRPLRVRRPSCSRSIGAAVPGAALCAGGGRRSVDLLHPTTTRAAPAAGHPDRA